MAETSVQEIQPWIAERIPVGIDDAWRHEIEDRVEAGRFPEILEDALVSAAIHSATEQRRALLEGIRWTTAFQARTKAELPTPSGGILKLDPGALLSVTDHGDPLFPDFQFDGFETATTVSLARHSFEERNAPVNGWHEVEWWLRPNNMLARGEDGIPRTPLEMLETGFDWASQYCDLAAIADARNLAFEPTYRRHDPLWVVDGPILSRDIKPRDGSYETNPLTKVPWKSVCREIDLELSRYLGNPGIDEDQILGLSTWVMMRLGARWYYKGLPGFTEGDAWRRVVAQEVKREVTGERYVEEGSHRLDQKTAQELGGRLGPDFVNQLMTSGISGPIQHLEGYELPRTLVVSSPQRYRISARNVRNRFFTWPLMKVKSKIESRKERREAEPIPSITPKSDDQP